MFYHLLDLLVCAGCRRALTLLAPTEEAQRTSMRMRPAQRASPPGAIVGPLPESSVDTRLATLLKPLASQPGTDRRDREVVVANGVLVCVSCGRWYPVRDRVPEVLPDHLRQWDADRKWLTTYCAASRCGGAEPVWRHLLDYAPSASEAGDKGAHFKLAEIAVMKRKLPEGFLGPAMVAPFNPSRPDFSMDLLARFVTTVSKLNCGVNGMVFDLGSGFGWTTEWLVRLGYQAIGVDICRDYILAGMPRHGEHMPHFVVGDIENLPLLDECVDATLSFDAFHHVPNRPLAMAELSRIMRPGASMAMVEPGIEHEHAAASIAVMQQHGILERGFDRAGLEGYIRNTQLDHVVHHRSDVHPHDVFTLRKSGAFETDSLTPRALVAALQPDGVGMCVMSGVPPTLILTATNLGDTTWLDRAPGEIGEVHLGANLFDSTHALLKEDYARVRLPHAVRPGQSVRLRCQLPPIRIPGNYVVELDMVDNGFLWFKDYQYGPVAWPVTVTPSALDLCPLETLESDSAPRIVPELLPSATDLLTSKVVQYPRPSRWTALTTPAWRLFRTQGILAVLRRAWVRLRRSVLPRSWTGSRGGHSLR